MAALILMFLLAPAIATASEPNAAPAAQPAASATETPRAAPPTSEAVRLYDEGLRHFRAGSYDRAIALLLEAYEQAPIPALLYDLAQAYRLAGDCVRARSAYQRFLATGPTGRARALAEARIGELGQCTDRPPEVKAPAPLTRVGPGAPSWSNAAPDLGTASTDGPSRREGAGRADGAGAALRLQEILPAAPPPATPREHRRVALVSSVASAVLGVTSVYFAWHATKMSEEVSAAFTPGGTWDDVRDADRTGRWDDRWAVATGVSALVAAGVAAWAFWK